MRVVHDFRSPASIEHLIPSGSSGAFDGATELGRATGELGSSNGIVRVSAATLGDWANLLKFVIAPLGSGQNAADLDPGSDNFGPSAPSFLFRPSATATAAQVAVAINASSPDPAYVPQPWQEANQRRSINDPLFLFGADNGSGTGASAPTPGNVTLAGGVAPVRPYAGCVQFTAASSANAGLFVFDGGQPLFLDAFIAVLSGSEAWTLSLQPLTPARFPVGSSCVIASGTGATVYVPSGFVIPGGWGLAFAASATGRAQAIVRSAKV